ncbi:MAG: hypothetical protein WC476_03210 [Phycisphaerae bacterium]
MFRTVSIIAFLVTFAGIGICCLVLPRCKQCRWTPSAVLKRAVHIFTMLLLEQKSGAVGIIRKLAYLLALVCFLVLAITSFFPVLVLEESINGYWLMLHATFAPVFAIALTTLVILWADNYRLNRRTETGKYGLAQKICFWLIVSLALPMVLSIILSMFALFGTEGQEFLLNTHRYCALLLSLVAIIYIYLIIRSHMERQ